MSQMCVAKPGPAAGGLTWALATTGPPVVRSCGATTWSLRDRNPFWLPMPLVTAHYGSGHANHFGKDIHLTFACNNKKQKKKKGSKESPMVRGRRGKRGKRGNRGTKKANEKSAKLLAGHTVDKVPTKELVKKKRTSRSTRRAAPQDGCKAHKVSILV